MNDKLQVLTLSYAAGITAALMMLVMGIFGNIGIYTGAVAQMQAMHLFFTLSIGGIIAGMIEAAIITFVMVYVFGAIYNKMVK